MLDALYIGSHNWIAPVRIVSTPFSYFLSIQELLLILHCKVACFADSPFKRLSSPIFQVSLVFISGTVYSSYQHVYGGRNIGGCFLNMLELGGAFSWFGRFTCVLILLPVWYSSMELIPFSSILLLLSGCSMARGQEETFTSQAGRRRGPGLDTPSESSIISSLSMEELRSYCQIPDNIDFELVDGPPESTIGKEDGVVYFTREQLVVGLRFLVSSLIKQFLHFFRAPPALIHSNVIRILTKCSILNLLYQLDISLVKVYFIYTLKIEHGGRVSLWAQSPRLQFVTRLPDLPKTEAKGVILVRGPWYETPGSLDLPFTLNRSMTFPGVFKLWDLYVVFIFSLHVYPTYFLNKYFFHVGKSRKGILVNWVEKASFKNIQKLLEIPRWKRHHRILLIVQIFVS